MAATREQVEKLKRDWLSDPCFSLSEAAHTESFREFTAELVAYEQAQEKRWKDAYESRLNKKAVQIGCPGNLTLARYVELLEERLTKLERTTQRVYAE